MTFGTDCYNIIQQSLYTDHSYCIGKVAMENNQFSIGVFVDLSKAFDTLNRNILLNKLYYYGIRGRSLWMV